MQPSAETFAVKFDDSEHRRQNRIAELLLRQAAMQYAILTAFERNQNRHVHTETCEPLTSYIKSALGDFNWRFMNGNGSSAFEFQVKLTGDIRDAIVTWDGQDELASLVRIRHNADPDPYENTERHSRIDVYDADDDGCDDSNE